MTIRSAQESVRLRLSDDPDDYSRATHEGAPADVWDEVLATAVGPEGLES